MSTRRRAFAVVLTATTVAVVLWDSGRLGRDELRGERRRGGAADVEVVPPDGVVHAVAAGSGDCSVGRPCSLGVALERLGPRQVLELGAGRYERLALASRHAGVTVRPRPGSSPVVAAVGLRAPDVSLRGLPFVGSIWVGPAATGATVSESVVRGGIAIQADQARLVDNDIGGTTDKDPVQITARPTGVVVERNRVHDGSSGPRRGHVDCIQITSGTDITVRDNDLRQCSNAALLVKPDLGDIHRITIEGNRLAACRPVSVRCRGSVALFVRNASHDIAQVLVRGNDVDGSSSFDRIRGLIVEDNVLQTLARGPACPAVSRGNTIRQRHRAACPLGDRDRYASDR